MEVTYLSLRKILLRTRPPRLDRKEWAKKSERFLTRSILYPSDNEIILAPFLENGYIIAPLRDVFCHEALHGKKVFTLRHDVDHDFETALRMADWERERGYRATYCVLHTAWYYGELVGDRYRHYRECIDFCLKLQELGHEVNLHNNFATVALETGVPAEELLGNELAALRGYGVEIVGTSTHGDKLCRELGFANLEIFKGRTWISRGGPRVVSTEKGSVDLGSICMADHGLSYEAYDYPRDIYVSDSGRRPRVGRMTRGIRGLRREELDFEIPFPSMCGTLTHPIWWDFTRPSSPDGEEPLFKKAYAEAVLNEKVLARDNPHEGPRLSANFPSF